MSQRESGGRGYVVVALENENQPSGVIAAAADEAERRNSDLAIVTVLRPHLDPESGVLGMRHDQQRAQATALQALHEAAVSVHPSHPGLSVTTYCLGDGEVGPNREPLLWAELLVVGPQQHGGSPGTPVTISRLLLDSSRCPVLTVAAVS
jgi:hypothetical protein